MLCQGLSVAAGLGAAAHIDGIGKAIYCIIGDGEVPRGAELGGDGFHR